MNNLLNKFAGVLANVTYSAAIAGANSASNGGIYQPKTPKALLK